MKKLKLLPVFLTILVLVSSIRIGDLAFRLNSLQDIRLTTQVQAADEETELGQSENPPSEVFGGDFGIPDKDFSDEDDFFDVGGFDSAEVKILQELSGRREQLDLRERQIQQKEALLKAAEQQLDQKLTELTKIRDEIQELLGQQSEKETKRIQSLVKVYEGMRPGDAANIFNELELSILIPVMENMSERKLSPILANMNANRARIITRRLAEKVQLPKLPERERF